MGEISHGMAPGRVPPSQKIKLVVFHPLYFQEPLSGLDFTLLSGPLRLKIDTCGPDMGPPKHVTCLFLLALHPQDRRGGEILLLSPPLAAPLMERRPYAWTDGRRGSSIDRALSVNET